MTTSYKLSIVNLLPEGRHVTFQSEDMFKRGHSDWGTYQKFKMRYGALH